MKADLEFVSRANTFMQMKIRLAECKAELREKIERIYNDGRSPLEVAEALEEILGE